MTNIFDLMSLKAAENTPLFWSHDAIKTVKTSFDSNDQEIEANAATLKILAAAATRHAERISESHSINSKTTLEMTDRFMTHLYEANTRGQLYEVLSEYLQDASERALLTMDTLRKRGDIFIEHEEAGCPPVLIYDYEVVMDGKLLPHPSNYMLLKILPPAGMTINDDLRPTS